MEKGFKRGWILGGIILLVILTGCMIGGSYYMLNFSLTPNARIRAKDADSYRYLYANYPFLRPWVDSLNQVNALKDTFILNRKAYDCMPTILQLQNLPQKQQSLCTVILTMR